MTAILEGNLPCPLLISFRNHVKNLSFLLSNKSYSAFPSDLFSNRGTPDTKTGSNVIVIGLRIVMKKHTHSLFPFIYATARAPSPALMAMTDDASMEYTGSIPEIAANSFPRVSASSGFCT